MTHLHEVLAAEKTVTNARDQLLKDTTDKFGKGDNFFKGFTKTLSLLGDDPSNDKIEAAAREDKELPTTVVTTLEYLFQYWNKAEDVLFRKNLTNTTAVADLEYQGDVIAHAVPVDELMGLETRLGDLRKLATQIPTLDASRSWVPDFTAAQSGTWKATLPAITTKTEKETTAVVLYPATDKHPAQVEKVSRDKIVGTVTVNHTSGATTAIQKARVLAVLDELIVEAKKARTRANSVPVIERDIASAITSLILAPLYEVPANNQE